MLKRNSKHKQSDTLRGLLDKPTGLNIPHSSPMIVSDLSVSRVKELAHERKAKRDARKQLKQVVQHQNIPDPTQSEPFSFAIMIGDIFESLIDPDIGPFKIDKLDVYSHLAFSDNGRVECWDALLDGTRYIRVLRVDRFTNVIPDHDDESMNSYSSFGSQRSNGSRSSLGSPSNLLSPVVCSSLSTKYKIHTTSGSCLSPQLMPVVKPQTQSHSPVFRTVPNNSYETNDTSAVAKHHHTQQQHNQEAARGADPTVMNYTTGLEEKIPLVYTKSCEIFCIAPCSNIMSKAVKRAVIPPISPVSPVCDANSDSDIMTDGVDFTDNDNDNDSAVTGLTAATGFSGIVSESIAASAAEPSKKFVKNLDLKNLSLGNVQSCAILKSVQLVEHLQEVDLTGNRLDEKGAAAIIKSLRGTGVRSIVLNSNKIGKKGVCAIIAFLENRPIDKYDEASIKRIGGLGTGNNSVPTNSVGTGVGSRTYGKGNVPVNIPPPITKGTFKNLMVKSTLNQTQQTYQNRNPDAYEDADDDTSVVTFESMSIPNGRSMYSAIQPTFPMADQIGLETDSIMNSVQNTQNTQSITRKPSNLSSVLSPLKHNAMSSSKVTKGSKTNNSRSNSLKSKSQHNLNDMAAIHIPLLSSFASSNMLTPLPNEGSHFIDDESMTETEVDNGSVDGSAFYSISGGDSRADKSISSYNYRILGAGAPPKLMKLCLNENKLGDHLIAKLIKCLNATCIYTLQELGLRNNMCGPQSAKALSAYVSTMTTNSTGTGTGSCRLRILDLGWNSLGDAGILTIFNPVIAASGLGNTVLINKITDIPLPNITNYKQFSLKSLSIDWNGLSGTCVTLLEKMIALVDREDNGSNNEINGILKTLCIENNPIPAPTMLTFIQRVHNIHRPDICKVTYSSFHFEFDQLQTTPMK